ncbi:MAG TPA: hypothetical protein VGD14_14765 [bacterium]
MKMLFIFLMTYLLLGFAFQSSKSQENWEFWKSYKTIIVDETDGLDRQDEPVEISLSIYKGEITNPEQEIRLVEILEKGDYKGIPSQVFEVQRHLGDQHIQFKIIFLTNVSPYETKTYKLFYNNPAAQRPSYSSDLIVNGEGFGLIIENHFYKADLTAGEGPKKSSDSGQIKEITILGDVNQKLARFDRRMHWSPNFIRADNDTNKSIAHWDRPENYLVEKGPIICLTKRWGSLKDIPEIFITATYKFYAHQPYFTFYSRMEMKQDIHLSRLRNDEMTSDTLFTHLAFKRADGSMVNTTFQNRDEILGKHPVESDTPWLCFYEPNNGFAFGSIRLFYNNTNIWGETSPTTGDYTKISNGDRGGKYWNRILILDKITLVPQGSVYAEKNAYIVFKLGEGENRFAAIEQYAQRLNRPLKVKVID